MDRCELVRRYYNLVHNKDVDDILSIPSRDLELINIKTDKEIISTLVFNDMKRKYHTLTMIKNRYGLSIRKSRKLHERFSNVIQES